MNPAVAMRELEAWCQEELAAKQREDRWLAELERALVTEDPEHVVRTVSELNSSREASAKREPRRDRARQVLADHFGLPLSACTLGSLAERSEEEGARLTQLRAALRGQIKSVGVRSKRVNTLARSQRRFLSGVLSELFGVDPNESLGGRDEAPCNGRLIDSRA